MHPIIFNELVRQALKRKGFKERDGYRLVELWDFFVRECESGYGWTLYEYDDEITVRDYLDAVLNDSAVLARPEATDLAEEVRKIDDRFRALLQTDAVRPDATPTWWRQGVLKVAGDEYRSDMKRRYSIRVASAE